jgi:hypothetical protein
MKDALERWKKRGQPPTSPKNHIELVRHELELDSDDGMLRINLNKNLYPHYDGRIFSEGSEFKDEEYVHVKLWDYRFEMTKEQFKTMAKGFHEAREALFNHEQQKSSDPSPSVQKT